MQEKQIWSVSQLNNNIRELIEDGFFPLWLKGEVGNITIHRSGHVYFTMKDQKAQMNIVYFKGANEATRLNLKEGLEIEAFGKVSVYEPRGNYQLNINEIRLVGIGDLQKKFEELKQKLYMEGLFEENNKKEIPKFPQKIGIITSPQGAAIQDFINIIKRRFNSLRIIIYPSPVQGEKAAQKLVQGLKWFNKQKNFDAIVIIRGGGSLEDLWEFNQEILARAIADSNIPVISGIGHEIDFTICDFVADLRVPTPSAAAEIIIRQKSDFKTMINNYKKCLKKLLLSNLNDKIMQRNLLQKQTKLLNPLHKLQIQIQHLDEINNKLTYLFNQLLNFYQKKILNIKNKIHTQSLQTTWQNKNIQLQKLKHQFQILNKEILQKRKQKVIILKQKLELLNPKNILKRGYAIIQDKEGKIIYEPNHVEHGDKLKVTLANGIMTVRKE